MEIKPLSPDDAPRPERQSRTFRATEQQPAEANSLTLHRRKQIRLLFRPYKSGLEKAQSHSQPGPHARTGFAVTKELTQVSEPTMWLLLAPRHMAETGSASREHPSASLPWRGPENHPERGRHVPRGAPTPAACPSSIPLSCRGGDLDERCRDACPAVMDFGEHAL